jgi:hypothetical protein
VKRLMRPFARNFRTGPGTKAVCALAAGDLLRIPLQNKTFPNDPQQKSSIISISYPQVFVPVHSCLRWRFRRYIPDSGTDDQAESEPEMANLSTQDLAKFAGQLRDHIREWEPGETGLSHAYASKMADAIDRVVSGKSPSMDHALGLKRGRGLPKHSRVEKFKVALHVISQRNKGKSWNDVVNSVPDYIAMDKREARRLYNTYKDLVVKRQVKKLTPRLEPTMSTKMEQRLLAMKRVAKSA